eukprot:COSAG01_NODE_39_length_33243_cov_28.298558_8_plen_221_part_00
MAGSAGGAILAAEVSHHGLLLSRGGRSSPANGSGRNTHCDSVTSCCGGSFQPVAIHINYGNRPEADAEAAYVQRWCMRHRIRCGPPSAPAPASASPAGCSWESPDAEPVSRLATWRRGSIRPAAVFEINGAVVYVMATQLPSPRHGVSGTFSPCGRSILAGIRLCHACSCQAIEGGHTAGREEGLRRGVTPRDEYERRSRRARYDMYHLRNTMIVIIPLD